MEAVWKYELTNASCQEIQMPEYAEVLTIQLLNNTPSMWVRVDPENKLVTHSFLVVWTGEKFDGIRSNYQYIGTYQSKNHLVYHVFKILNPDLITPSIK